MPDHLVPLGVAQDAACRAVACVLRREREALGVVSVGLTEDDVADIVQAALDYHFRRHRRGHGLGGDVNSYHQDKLRRCEKVVEKHDRVKQLRAQAKGLDESCGFCGRTLKEPNADCPGTYHADPEAAERIEKLELEIAELLMGVEPLPEEGA